MNDSSITCISGEFEGDFSEAMSAGVVVYIGNAMITQNGVVFSYREDPVYISVSPQKVIPA